jgi:hypothetical protein
VKYTKMHYSPNTGQHIIDSLKPKDHAVTRLA